MKITQFLCSRSGNSQFKYFQRWVEREMHGDQIRSSYQPLRGWIEMKKNNWHFEEHRAWSEDFKRQNAPGVRNNKYYVQPVKEHSIFKGDRVELLVGKDKGKHGVITTIIKERNWCFVDSLNCEYNWVSTGTGFEPRMQRKERPLLITSQVKLVDPSDDKGCDIEWRYDEKGERVRVSTRSGRIIPLPAAAAELEDGVHPSSYIDNKEKDTPEKILQKVTFEPKLMTFDEEILDSMNIKDERKPAKTYYY